MPFSGQTLVVGNAPGVTIRDTEIHDSTYDGIQVTEPGSRFVIDHG
ncbi:hypothetical protein [Streptomyces griseosporeus]|nr:hypothetical protein [Streptomyces griseosporeus]GHF55488.1 hypothetical protein GCM10018783_25800 [Streptomyces griseosporeus]